MYLFFLSTIQSLNLNWTNVVTAIIGALFSIVGIYLNDKLKNKKKNSDDFQALIDANTKYREEIRRDLVISKEEVQTAWAEIEESRKIIKQLETKNQLFEDQILSLTAEIDRKYGFREKLRQCEDRFLNISNSMPAGIFRTDKTGNCVFVNKKWCELTGLSAEEAMGDGWKKSIHPDDIKNVMEHWNDTMKKHTSFKLSYRFLRPDKSTVKVEGKAIREECLDNKLIGYLGYLIEQNNGNNTIEHNI